MDEQPGQDLDARLLTGGAEDFGLFYRRHERAVVAYFRRRVGDPELVADLVAETFAQALASKRAFRPERGVARGWLFGVAAHVLARSVRRSQVESRARRRLGVEPLAFTDEELERIDLLGQEDLVAAALEGIPDEHREAVLLRVVEEHSYGDIAKRVRCSEALARQRVRRGLRAMRTTLEGGA